MIMRITHVTTELSPIAKAGGLGDVVYGLAKELLKLKHQVEIILPCYQFLNLEKKEIATFIETEASTKHEIKVYEAKFENIKIILIKPPHYFNEKEIYGGNNENDRFLFFAKATATFLEDHYKHPDIIHVHDWPLGILPLLLKSITHFPAKTVLTIHNGEYQGICNTENLLKIGLDPKKHLPKIKDSREHNKINLLKAGVLYADYANTVSPTYAKEISTYFPKKLQGILNGIDTDYWNPKNDPLIPVPFSKDLTESKEANKKHLFEELNLKTKNTPLYCSITRLVPQKGPDTLLSAIKQIKKKGAQFVLLGSSPDPSIKAKFLNLKNELKDDPSISINLHFSESLAHQIYAASDFILIPSVFEPCGLSQMIGMHYGTIPIANNTGGLSDTIDDRKTGYLAKNLDEFSLKIDQSFDDYHTKEHLRIRAKGHEIDFSFTDSTKEYLKAYKSLIS